MTTLILTGLLRVLKTRRALVLENLALRHQLAVLQRAAPRPRLRPADRLFWVLLCRTWSAWADALSLVKPETVIRWHRTGFTRYWTWKSRRTGQGRPALSPEVRALIPRMSRANPLWGAPRIHGELQKLGVEISQATVSKYMARHRRPPSQTWRTFSTTTSGAWSAARLPHLLPPLPNPPLTGEGRTRAETGRSPRPGQYRRDTHGRRPASPVHTAGCVGSPLC